MATKPSEPHPEPSAPYPMQEIPICQIHVPDTQQPQIVVTQPVLDAEITALRSQNSRARCLAIFTSLCCVCPLGLAAMMYVNKARDDLNQNRIQDARLKKNKSLKLSCASIICGIILFFLTLFVLQMLDKIFFPSPK